MEEKNTMEQETPPSANETNSEEGSTQPPAEFKKPILLVGRVGKLPRKARDAEAAPAPPVSVVAPLPAAPAPHKDSPLPPAVLLKELSTPIPYREPKWSGLPPEEANYRLEVLKSGVILEEIALSKPYLVLGRLANCDVVLAHPTISRHHAVIQYKATSDADSDQPIGWYVWDCGSTHGSFLNRRQLTEGTYARLRVGHMLKLGCSTRQFILLGPEWDAEGESELTVTEMKQKHAEMKAAREKEIADAAEKRQKETEQAQKKREEDGIDWGMGEDAEDEPDLAENPFATTSNEELFLNDPKKTLRGYYEREGLELQYQCEEKAPGQFLCSVELPIDDSRGRSLIAQVLHRGKKKEAVVACALEACRVLDRHGLLRQAQHAPRRRQTRPEDDDSDDDTFFERTGAVEERRNRKLMRPDKLTYAALTEKSGELRAQLAALSARLDGLRAPAGADAADSKEDEDELDRYMTSLADRRQSMSRKADISKLKSEIARLKGELSRTDRLAELARPADLPPLLPDASAAKTSGLQVKLGSNSVIYGKRLKLKHDPATRVKKEVIKKTDEEFVEEVDSDEEKHEHKDEKLDKETEDKNISKDNDVSVKTEDINPNDKTREDNNEETIKSERDSTSEKDNKETKSIRLYGPMRPPENYVMPEGYLMSDTDRDDQQVMEDD